MENKQEVLENILLADQYMKTMFPNIGRVRLILVGGAAIILKGFENKVTTDIDTVVKLEEDVSDFLRSFAINNDAAEVSVLPEDYESRMEEIVLGLEVLEVYVVSNEDLVISKVGRYDTDDKRDLEDTGILDYVNTERLIDLGEQVSTENQKFKQNWNTFRKLSLFG